MDKFKVGDKVKIVRTGYGFGAENLGKIVTIVRKGSSYMHGIDGYYIKEGVGNGARDVCCGENSFELVEYPNPPHKHMDLIIAWANGAEIETLSYKGYWHTSLNPSWHVSYQYRVKPADTRKDKLNAKR